MGRTSDARQRLLDAALQAFWTRGCFCVGVDSLCKEAGINKGSFYHFFPSKQELLLETLDLFWKLFREAVIEPAFDPQLPPIERVRQLFLRHYKVQLEALENNGWVPGCPFLNVGSEMSPHDPELRNRINGILGRSIAYIESALREAAIAGMFFGDPARQARTIQASLMGLLTQAKIANDPAVILDGYPDVLRRLDTNSAAVNHLA